MIKRILVPTDGSESATVGVRYAVALAKKYAASITGLHVVDVKLLEGPFLRDLSASLGTAPYVNYQGNIAMILEERGKTALAGCQQICAEQGVTCETMQRTGVVSRLIVEASDLADLIVMGRGGEHSEWLEGLVGSTTEAVIRRSSQPVLITGTDTPGEKCLLVAYDGSHQSKQALKAVTTIAGDWQSPFHVLVVSDDPQPIAHEAESYLRSRDIEAQFVLRDGDPGEIIVEYAAECGAALLVMGAYGHSKIRELFVGSTTSYAINHAPCPVLLSR